jgi:hypothetical protein
MKQDKEQILVGTRVPKSDLTLPKEVSDILIALPLDERRAYVFELRKAGWTLQSMATPLASLSTDSKTATPAPAWRIVNMCL